MADLTITATSVVPGSNAVKETGVALSTITAGQVVYRDPTTLKFAPADANSATAAIRAAYGIALNGAAAGQPVTVQTDGDITIGATLVVGVVYVLSATAGGIAPAADVADGDYVSVIGTPTSTTVLRLAIVQSGAVADVP